MQTKDNVKGLIIFKYFFKRLNYLINEKLFILEQNIIIDQGIRITHICYI